MGIVLKELISFMEKTVPRYLSEKWDNAGFLIGDAEKTVRRVLICLDVTSDVVEEAVSKKVDLIISHHPIIFNGLKSITTESPSGKNIIRLIENGVCVYSAHTNLDIAENGVNDTLAKRLGINVEGNIEDTYVEKLYKFVVFVPEDYWDTVRESICRAGAGRLGNYGDCTFSVDGTGTFMPLSGSNPFIGKAGELEKVKEKRLEAIVPEKSLNGVVKAMFSAHPYEVPAYDIYELKIDGNKLGLGRIGKLPSKMGFDEFISHVKACLELDHLRVVGRPANGNVERVAVFCGSFGLDPVELKKLNADVVVTGDVKYHQAIDALQSGLCLVDAGHYGTERIVLPELAKAVSEKFPDLSIELSTAGNDPFDYYD